MKQSADVTISDVALYFLPIECETPLVFGNSAMISVTCARVALTASGRDGAHATGWGEVPLNVQWAWPSPSAPELRDAAMRRFCVLLAEALRQSGERAHPFELMYLFSREQLFPLAGKPLQLPTLAATVCLAAFDQALYDAYGKLNGVGVFESFSEQWMNFDLGRYYGDGMDNATNEAHKLFVECYPHRYLDTRRHNMLPAWHLVGFADVLGPVGERASADNSSLPQSLQHWILRDGIQLIKIKLMGQDVDTDAERVCAVAAVALPLGVRTFSLDLNRTPRDAGYVHALFDRLECDAKDAYRRILYVEEPLHSDLFGDRAAVTSLADRKPLYMDESAEGWTDVASGRKAGWSGVALKTCKTITGSILSLCWARQHGMPLMVQDLTNPMLAQLAHLSFAAHVGTVLGVESNSMQYYPRASEPEAQIHPGAYRRHNGLLDISTLAGPGFGYRLEEMERELPERVA